jgi:phosphotriesterase-related protein
MDRRAFLMTTAAAGTGAMLGVGCGGTEHAVGEVMTVDGPISPNQMGFTLTHEHVLVDFIGAEQVSPDRYDRDEAFGKIVPHLQQAKELGCATFVECTPSYIGKDVRLLQRLSTASGLQILTNVGYYGAADDKYVPAHAYDESAEQLAHRWVREWEEGIDGTDVRPGFIKVGVDGTSLSEIDRKLVVAAAKTHRRTGLLILSHTGYATPAVEQIEIVKAEGIHPSAWVWTHAQNEKDNAEHEKAARQGAWIAFDGLHRSELDRDEGPGLPGQRTALARRGLVPSGRAGRRQLPPPRRHVHDGATRAEGERVHQRGDPHADGCEPAACLRDRGARDVVATERWRVDRLSERVRRELVKRGSS